MQKLKKNILYISGVTAILLGVCVSMYLVYQRLFPPKEWTFEVSGNNVLTSQEIEKIVLYSIQRNSQNITKKTIEEALLLDPRVKSVNLSQESLGKQLFIQLKERQTAYIVHEQNSGNFLEVSNDNVILQEKIIELEPHILSEIPILCLTFDNSVKETAISFERDIMQIYKETRKDFLFVWQRISEINLHKDHYIIYTSHTRSEIKSNIKLDIAFIKRLWSLFYYLEVEYRGDWTSVHLYPQNAIIKRVL